MTTFISQIGLLILIVNYTFAQVPNVFELVNAYSDQDRIKQSAVTHRLVADLLTQPFQAAQYFEDVPAQQLGWLLGRFAVSPREYNLTAACYNASWAVVNALGQPDSPWAFQMVDATTKVESGLTQGNFLWLGSFDECISVVANAAANSSAMHAAAAADGSGVMFTGQACSVAVMNASTAISTPATFAMALTLAVCVPSVCTPEDAQNLVNNVLTVLPADYQAVSAQCHTSEMPPLNTPATAVICVLGILGFILLLATVYDIAVLQGHWLPCRSKSKGVSVADDTDILTPGSDYAEIHGDVLSVTPSGTISLLDKVATCLSMYSNGAKILSVRSRTEGNLACMHGIRFLSMTWVMLGHTFAFSILFMKNLVDLPKMLSGFASQGISNAFVSVDSFFVLSGTLVAYIMLREIKKKNGPRNVNWALFYFHRFWRLTPAYMLILGIHTSLFIYLGSGPLWPIDSAGIDTTCPRSWWANLLYINNIVPNHKDCMAWSWYLANDMQFFVVSPIFILALYWRRWFGVLLVCVTLLASTVYVAVYTAHFDIFPGITGLTTTMPTDNWLQWFDDVYVTPWCRITPYLVGLLLGYTLHETNCRANLNKWLVAAGWAAAIAGGLGVVYGLYGVANGHPMSPAGNAIYGCLYRTVWGLALAWIIYACTTGYGGFVNRLLSWEAFVPLSRLTYMAYLVHPIVMYVYNQSLRHSFYCDPLVMVYQFFGHLVTSYCVAFACSLAFEAPMMGLEKIVFKK